MDINDIKHLAVERIFLVPDASEGQLGYVWCDDPAPSEGMVASEAVEYVRKDVHDAIIKRQASSARMGMSAAKEHGSHMEAAAKRLHAECNPEALESERAANALLTERIAQLEADCAAHKAAEEVQIALRQKADEREAALAAHVEQLRGALRPLAYGGASDCIARGDFSVMRERVKDWLGVRDFKNARTAFDSIPTTSLARRDAEQQKIGAASFRHELNEASSVVIRPHIQGVFEVWLRQQAEALNE